MARELKARPLFLILAGLLFGLTFPSISWLFCLGIGAAIIYRQTWLAVVCFGVFIAGFLSLWRTPASILGPGDFSGRVAIHSFPNFYKGKNLYAFESLSGEHTTGILRVEPSVSLSPGTVVEVAGHANDTRSGSLTPSSLRVISSYRLLDWLVIIQRRAIDRTNELFGREDGSWVTALTFNFPSDLSSEEKSDLRFNGTYHMVSASGMHVWVIAFALHGLLRSLGLGRHWQLLAVFLLLLAYCSITGFHAPTLRAAMMWLIASSAYLFRRSPDGLSALSLSALLWLFFVPSDAFTAGFQLSYIVSGSLLLWFERLRFEGYKSRHLFEASFIAMLASEPLASWWFGQMIFIAPVSNLLIELPSQAVMILGFLCLIPLVGNVLVYVAKPLIWWMKWTTQLTAGFPLLLMNRYALPPFVLVLYYAFLLWVFLGQTPTLRNPFRKA